MEKRVKRYRKRKNNIRKGIVSVITVLAVTAGCIAVVHALTGGKLVNGYMQADYMHGETEALNSVDSIYEYADKNIEEKVQETIQETSYSAESTQIGSYKRLDVECVLQNPELPTGCEITALTCILNYLGYDVDKLTMADEFLDKGGIDITSPYKAFVGNPRNEYAYGAFAPVIVNSAKKYLDRVGSELNVYNVTGADYEELTAYVSQGHPVLVWETMWMVKPQETDVFDIDGELIPWLSNEHVMVLIGYTRDTYIMADPLRGICEYDKELAQERYADMGSQAIVIY